MAGPANTPHARPGGLATGLDLIRMRQAARSASTPYVSGRQALIAWSQQGANERSKSPESRICGTTNSNMSTLSREKCAIGGLSGFVSTVV